MSKLKTYPPDSDVADLIAELVSSGEKLRVQVGDETYVVSLNSDVDVEDSPDPESVARTIAGIERAAGSWDDEDSKEFLDYVYRRRDMPPRPKVEL